MSFYGMTSLSIQSVFNTTLFGELIRHISECTTSIYDFLLSSANSFKSEDITSIVPVVTFADHLSQIFYFDDFQTTLLKTFLFMKVTTLLLIYLSWRVYGKKISERFMKPATSKAIQELKDSVSKLKLPKEHTPRI